MLSKFEIVGIGFSVLFMAVALYLVRIETTMLTGAEERSAQLAQVQDPGLVMVNSTEGTTGNRATALAGATDKNGNINQLVVDDISIGEGSAVEVGDTVTVHYIGKLQNGQEFDNSRKRGEPFTFTVGDGAVISGWERGLVGMKSGGQRILVVPPSLAYGDKKIGPIPPNSTLVFAIELLDIR